MLTKDRKGNLFYQYLLTYFIVLFIPLAICSVYCVKVLAVIGRNEVRAYEAEIRHAAVLVETMLDKISETGNQLAVNPQVGIFQYRKDVYQYPHAYEINQLQQALPQVYQTNQLVFDYFLFFGQSEMVVNPSVAYTYRDFYDLYLQEEKYGSYEEWYCQVKETVPDYGLSPMEMFAVRGEEKANLMVYTQPLPNMKDNSALRIYVQDKELAKLLPALPEGGIQYFEDSQGELLYYMSDSRGDDYADIREQLSRVRWDRENIWNRRVKVADKVYFAVRYHSEASGLTFFMLRPDTSVNSTWLSDATGYLLLILLAVAVGIVLCWRMALRTTRPINDVLKEMPQSAWPGEGQSVFSVLKTAFRELRRENSTLAKAIERQKPYIRNAFFNRLIYGDIISEEEGLQIADSLGIEMRESIFCVLIFRFEPRGNVLAGSDEERAAEASGIISLMEVMERILPHSLYANSGEDEVILLFSPQQGGAMRQEAEEKISLIRKQLPEAIAGKLSVYGGSEAEGLTGIHKSYDDAVFLLWSGKGCRENGTVWHTDAKVDVPVYPAVDFAGKLTYYVASGDVKGLHDELENTVRQYVFENNLPVYLQHMLLNEFQVVLFWTLGRIRMEEEEYRGYCHTLEENRNAPLLEQMSTTFRLFRSLCEYVDRQKQTRGEDNTAAKAVAYIDMNYMDSNLSLAGVADGLGIGESTLSGLFKQAMGINFSTYVENVRIEKAKILLKTTEAPVKEIAEQVGYSSVNSFCRAFKRVTGESASAHRQG